ncbi:MAG: polyphosphate polymerase domain-containing protein [Chloroflexi bacterium]|nr:polyphosphate polymerase domain-containing protein [Chloroflexota bacterium]
MKASLRYELKMVFNALRLAEVRSWVFSHSFAFKEVYPLRYVNNIYFDTQEWEMLDTHINGVNERAKVRYRWYGKTRTPAQGQIEIKVKQGQLGYKKLSDFSETLFLNKSNWLEITRQFQDKSEEEFSKLFNVFSPVMINQYKREYYASADKRVRITLDYDMRVFDQTLSSKPNVKYEQPLQNNVVIEVKAEQEYHQRVADTLAQFPIYCQQHSKYLNGLEHLWA